VRVRTEKLDRPFNFNSTMFRAMAEPTGAAMEDHQCDCFFLRR
jgi:hypothetical protein